jgi:hypothetical protein
VKLRIAFALAGLAMLTYGAVLAWDFATARSVNAVQGLAWFVGGPILHDAVAAPVVGVLGVLLTRYVPVAWRAPVAVGAVLSGVLTLLAIPLLWRPFGVATNPGLHDQDYGTGFALALGVVWVCVLVAGLYRARRRSPVVSDAPADA